MRPIATSHTRIPPNVSILYIFKRIGRSNSSMYK